MVGIKVDDSFGFKGLEKRVIELASNEIPAKSLKPIKVNQKGEIVIYCKAETDEMGNPKKVGCDIRMKGDIKYGEFENLCKVGYQRGRYKVHLLYAFESKTCGFTLQARDIVYC